LWPFSTLGWPDLTEDLERYYPNNCLVTGYDIIPFWVNRMTFQGLHFTAKRPFKDCLIHGLIRDKEGRKMSKSLGNGVDPMDVIDEYGADSLRFFLTTNSAPGMDLRYDEEKVKSTWNFINKLWNASRYVFMNMEDFRRENYTLENLSLTDKWILEKLNKLVASVRISMEKYEYHNVGNELYNFIWEDFCDWYIELSKANMNDTTKSVLLKVLTSILKMLHPFMPYVTEEIYQMLPIKEEKSIMISSYPKVEDIDYSMEKDTIDKVLEDIVSIRNLKQSNHITKEAMIKVEVAESLKDTYYSQLKIKEENLLTEIPSDMLNINYKSKNIDITYYYEGNKEDDTKRQEEIAKLKASIARREGLLSNENYVNKAPANIVEMDRKKLEEEKEKLTLLEK
ncbi:MAG: class I tRNA ligase family protein, partial [bacterium]|nr:class I tRNA ligase family protein [bacterium]